MDRYFGYVLETEKGGLCALGRGGYGGFAEGGGSVIFVGGGKRRDVVGGDELKVTARRVGLGFVGILLRWVLLLSKEVCGAGKGAGEEAGRIKGVSRAAQGATKAARELRLQKVVG